METVPPLLKEAAASSSVAATVQLERLEALFFRIALSEDSKAGLQSVVDQYLIKILQYLSPTPSDAVKSKVVEILTHLNKRLQANADIELPLMGLFELLASGKPPQQQQPSLLLVNFAKVYIRMGFRRLDARSSIPLLCHVLKSPVLSPEHDKPLFIFLLTSCLKQLTNKSMLENNNNSEACNNQLPPASSLSPACIRVLLAILLFPYGPLSPGAAAAGLSASEVKAVSDGGCASTSDELEALKVALINVIAVMFSVNTNTKSSSKLSTSSSSSTAEAVITVDQSCAEAFAAHYAVAVSDPVSRVGQYAEIHLRELNNSIDWSGSPRVLEALIQLYLGSSATSRPQQTSTTAAAAAAGLTISPADLRLRLKLMPLIAKFSSKVTCDLRSRCLQLLFDTLFSPVSSSKLKQLALTFSHSWLDAWPWEKLTSLSAILSSAFVQVAANKSSSEVESVRALAYFAIGKLFSKFPSLIEANFDLVKSMFRIIISSSSSSTTTTTAATDNTTGAHGENNVATIVGAPNNDNTEPASSWSLVEDVEAALNMLAPAICHSIAVESRDVIYQELERLCELAGTGGAASGGTNRKTGKLPARLALRYLRLFPAKHLPSKFLLFQLSSTSVDVDFQRECRFSVFEPYLPKEQQPLSLINGVANPSRPEQVAYPSFVELIRFFSQQWNVNKNNAAVAITYGNQVLPFSAQTCSNVLLFLRTVLAVAEVGAPPTDVLVATLQFSELQRTSPAIHNYFLLKHQTSQSSSSSKPDDDDAAFRTALQQYTSMLVQVLQCVSDPSVLFLLVELMKTSHFYFRHLPWSHFAPMLAVAQPFASSTSNFDAVELFAELYAAIHGIVDDGSSSYSPFQVEEHLASSGLTKYARPSVRMLCLAHMLAMRLRSGCVPSNLATEINDYFSAQFTLALPDKSNVSGGGGSNAVAYGDVYDRLVVLKAISVAATFLPLWKCQSLPERIGESWTKALSAKESRLRPWAIQAFGRLGCSIVAVGNRKGDAGDAGDAAGEFRRMAVGKLLAIAPDEDVYMWIAQALVDLTLGPLSLSNCNNWCFDPATARVDAGVATADQLFAVKYAIFSCCSAGDNNNNKAATSSDLTEAIAVGSEEFNRVVDLLLTGLRTSNKFIKECNLVCLFLMVRSAFYLFPDVVRSRFGTINQSLFGLLSENNAHIQQTLCELLAFSYEAMQDSERDTQLQSLVDVLMGKRTVGLSVAATGAETEVFKDGQLGEMPDGQRLTTYKELCSLASDLNQPDLVYQFMQLANHNASWLSKSAAASGLGSILAKTTTSSAKSMASTSASSGDAGKNNNNNNNDNNDSTPNRRLASSLLSGVGKLYRYQFDPDANVRQTMNELWQTVLSTTGSNVRDLVNANLDVIFADIDASLPNRLWRVRESACGALSDAVRVLVDPHDKRLLKKLPSFWNAILHLCDDIKESVRVAAAKTARSLQKVTVRLAQYRKGSSSEQAAVRSGGEEKEALTNVENSEASQCLGAVIDILFKSGVESKAEEVKAVSLATLMMLVDSASSDLLASQCCALLPAFLEAVSSLEPQVLSYVTVRASDETELSALESIRVRVAGTSPIAHAVTQCIDIVPLEMLPDLFVRLADLLKPSAGLLTRSATCQAIIQLVTRRLRPATNNNNNNNSLPPVLPSDNNSSAMTASAALNRLFNALLSSCADRSETIRRTAASALSQLCSGLNKSQWLSSSDVFVKKTAVKACEWYLKGSLQMDDDSDPLLSKAACGLFQALTQHCPLDVLQQQQQQQQSVLATIVPCVFFAMHEKYVVEDGSKRVIAPQPDAWDDIWNELTPGTESALRKYTDEVCELLTRSSQVQRYASRLQTAIAIETVISRVAAHLTAEQRTQLGRCLLTLLQGRTYKGKEVVLEVCVKFFEQTTTTKTEEGGDRRLITMIDDELVSALSRESRKSQLDYSTKAFQALCVVVSSLVIVTDFSSTPSDDSGESGRRDNNNIATVVNGSFDDFLARLCTSLTATDSSNNNGDANDTSSNVDVDNNGNGFSTSNNNSNVLKKLSAVADFVDAVNKCKILRSHVAAASTQTVIIVNVMQLFCLAMINTTCSNATKQLSVRLTGGFEQLLAVLFVDGDDGCKYKENIMANIIMTDDNDPQQIFKQAAIECAKLSEKLTDARTLEMAGRFLKCFRHLFGACPAIMLPMMAINNGNNSNNNNNSDSNLIRSQIAELCRYIRRTSTDANNNNYCDDNDRLSSTRKVLSFFEEAFITSTTDTML